MIGTEQSEIFTPLDFAVIALLERVNCEVVEPKILKWEQELERPNPRIAQRLASGFLTVWPQLKQDTAAEESKQQLDDFVWGRSTRAPVEVLVKLLRTSGHFLFNSYYYVVLHEFGEEGLAPAIPGCTSAIDTRAYKTLQKLIQCSHLPLHVNEQYLDTYSTLLMPLRAGITPRFLQLYFSGFEAPTCLVGNFLGDFALLQKREDFVHRHLAALMIAMGEPGNVPSDAEGTNISLRRRFGAFVLTAAIPHAFNSEDENHLRAVVRDSWGHAPLELIHSGLRRDLRAMSCDLKWAGKGSAQRREVTSQQIRDTIHQTLGRMTKDGWYLLRGRLDDSGEEMAQLAAINLEGLDRVFSCQFPAGPWLDPTLVSDADLPGLNSCQPIVDVAKLTRLCGAIDRWSSPTNSHADRVLGLVELMKNRGFAGMIGALFPDFSTETAGWADRLQSSFIIEPVRDGAGLQRGRLLIMRGGAAESPCNDSASGMDPSTIEVVRTIAHRLSPAFDEHLLPGATNTFLARIKRTWSEKFSLAHSSSENERLDDSASALTLTINQLMEQDPAIRGLALLVERETYIPESFGAEETRDSLSASLLAYPSFWLFESLCHLLVENVRIDPFLSQLPQLPPDMWAPPFQSDEAEATLVLSSDDDANRAFASALTYLGLPIRNCDTTPVSTRKGPAWVINPASLSIDITTIYRNHLKVRLSKGGSEASLRRAWADSKLADKVSHVEVEVPEPTLNVRGSISEVAFLIVGPSFPPIPFRWKPQQTCEVAFTAFSKEAILSRHMKVRGDRPLHDCLTLNLNALGASGGVGRWTLEDGGPADPKLTGLFDVLSAEVTKLRKTYRAGVVEQQLQLAHDIRREFPPLSMVLSDTTINGIEEKGVERKIARAWSSLKRIQLKTNAASEFATKDYLFPDSTSSVAMASYLIDLGITDGVQSSEVLDGETIAPYMESLLTAAVQRNLFLDGLRFPPGSDSSLTQRLRAEKLLLTIVANAAKHLSEFIFGRLCSRESGRIEDIREMPLFSDLIGVEIHRGRITVWNLGSEITGDEFRSRFQQGKGKTFSILKGLVEDAIWDTPGEILPDALPPDTPVYRVAGQQPLRCSVYTVSVSLPEPFFREMPCPAPT